MSDEYEYMKPSVISIGELQKENLRIASQLNELVMALEEIAVETCEDWTRWKVREALARVKDK